MEINGDRGGGEEWKRRIDCCSNWSSRGRGSRDDGASEEPETNRIEFRTGREGETHCLRGSM